MAKAKKPGSKMNNLDLTAALRSKEIDKFLQAEKEKSARDIKLLLLGAGESGKSTIVKQMKIIHAKGYTDEERRQFISVIHSNAMQAMMSVILAMGDLAIGFKDPGRADDAKTILGLCSNHDEPEVKITPDIAAIMTRLWNDSRFQECLKRSNEYQLIDSAEYYLSSLDRLSKPKYVPTDQDILRARVKTTGIVEFSFTISGTRFRVFDVGGQRTERKKWIHCFDDVNAIIFVVALSEYDLTLREDSSVNRMQESMQLFGSVCNSPWFVNTSIILFLNKKDLFEQKIQVTPLSTYFPAYAGANEFEEAAQFLEEQFDNLNQHRRTKMIYMRHTCATDTKNMQFVFDAVTHNIMQKHMEDLGFM